MRVYLSLTILLSGLCAAAEPPRCDSPAHCNRLGTSAYQAGRHAEAIELFERQLRYAEKENGSSSARELALNNLMLATLRAGQAEMARAWLEVALAAGLEGSATRHNLGQVMDAVQLAPLADTPEGHYLHYVGQAIWSTLDIRRDADGSLRAAFFPVRPGFNVEQYGPAAIGELEGKLEGPGAYFRLRDAGLAATCPVDLLRSGPDMRVLERFAVDCQTYGGAGATIAGSYIKVSNTPER